MMIPQDLTREQYVYMAKLAEKAERYKEMAKYMDKLVLTTAASSSELTMEECNLLSVAYKNVIDSLRTAWRNISLTQQKAEDLKNNDSNVTLVRGYRSKIESKLSDVCACVLNLLDDCLIPTAVANESKVFYLKMKGDYHRYLAEFKTGDERKLAVNDTMNAYKTAQEIAALTDLPPNHPTRLGLALNFTVFYYEILNDVDRARSMAKQAFEEAAMAKMYRLGKGKESYKDDTDLIMKLLSDNFALWTSDEAYTNYYD